MKDDQRLHLDFEKAVRLLSEHFPISKPDSRKPILFHVLRVGVRLYAVRSFPE